MREIIEGQKLSYDLERDKKSGKMSATNLQTRRVEPPLPVG
jgi:CspA family cold shock protein